MKSNVEKLLSLDVWLAVGPAQYGPRPLCLLPICLGWIAGCDACGCCLFDGCAASLKYQPCITCEPPRELGRTTARAHLPRPPYVGDVVATLTTFALDMNDSFMGRRVIGFPCPVGDPRRRVPVVPPQGVGVRSRPKVGATLAALGWCGLLRMLPQKGHLLLTHPGPSVGEATKDGDSHWHAR